MKRQVTRISILQSSKIVTALYAFLGGLYTLIGMLLILFGGQKLLAIAMIYILGPLWMAIIGFIGFVISAALYNWLASMLGGFEYEVTDVSQS